MLFLVFVKKMGKKKEGGFGDFYGSSCGVFSLIVPKRSVVTVTVGCVGKVRY